MSERYEYWDITVGWTPAKGEMGAWAETGGHVSVEDASTAEKALSALREWRDIGTRRLESISIRLRRVEGVPARYREAARVAKASPPPTTHWLKVGK